MDAASIWSLEYLMGNWRPSFHDNFFMGWLITGSYFSCAFVAALYATFLSQMEEKKALQFWWSISVIMILLGVNKQLNLQTLLTEVGRQIAHAQEWYDRRRVVQLMFISILSASFMAAFIGLAIIFRDLLMRYLLAFCGLLLLLSYVIIRAASFHHISELIQYDLEGSKMNGVLELAGIYFVMWTGLKEMLLSRTRTN
jgi:hypothetical protein